MPPPSSRPVPGRRARKLKHLTWREFARRFYREFEEDTVTD
jgi:membrane protein